MVDREASMNPIDALANAFGIESEFVDAHGETHQISTGTKRSLLRALGADALDDTAAQTALSVLEAKAWQHALPPVHVSSSRQITVPIVCATGTTTVSWRIYLENGAAVSGVSNFASMPIIENRSVGVQNLERRSLALTELPLGYHYLQIDGTDERMTLIVTPPACILPETLVQHRGWGVAIQLYAVRSESNWGIGDFGDLLRLTGVFADGGADVIGLNPLHAMFLDDPEHASPYSPASRLMLNVLNIDVTATPGFAYSLAAKELVKSEAFRERLVACRAASHVQYAEVCALKLQVLRLVFAECGSETETPEFTAFILKGGDGLRHGCLFQVLRDHFRATRSGVTRWRSWPAEFHDPKSQAVCSFEAEHGEELRFQYWLQWIADQQLADSAAAASAAGMRVGLYRDLAVGSDPNGVEAWSNHAAVVQSATVGAPPDILNTNGQNWGLPPFHPNGLREEAYRSFIELVRANMRHAGAIRIDHVMALQHLYLIPENAQPADGAYVRYPLDDLVGILALESSRNGCLVIGEDLGTVPAGFRERMSAANILSYRVLFFERGDGGTFLPPDAYPEAALAVVASHDLATLRAWLDGSDIILRVKVGLMSKSAYIAQLDQRESDRTALVDALMSQELLARSLRHDDAAIVEAAHAFLARTPAALVMAQLDDITGETEPVNMPATTDEYPNWRRRISLRLEDIAGSGTFIRLSKAFDAAGRTNAKESSPHRNTFGAAS